MIRHQSLEHRFVRTMPRELEPGVIYVSMEYATAVHSCCCGCGRRIVTPFAPNGWKLTFNGESISLHPSIGNWQQACKSHYVIREGRVIEPERWSRIDGVPRDQRTKGPHQGSRAGAQPAAQLKPSSANSEAGVNGKSSETPEKAQGGGFWAAVARRLFNLEDR